MYLAIPATSTCICAPHKQNHVRFTVESKLAQFGKGGALQPYSMLRLHQLHFLVLVVIMFRITAKGDAALV
jgi:hypothetical protein